LQKLKDVQLGRSRHAYSMQSVNLCMYWRRRRI